MLILEQLFFINFEMCNVVFQDNFIFLVIFGILQVSDTIYFTYLLSDSLVHV